MISYFDGGRVGEIVLHIGGIAVAPEGVLRHVHPLDDDCGWALFGNHTAGKRPREGHIVYMSFIGIKYAVWLYTLCIVYILCVCACVFTTGGGVFL